MTSKAFVLMNLEQPIKQCYTLTIEMRKEKGVCRDGRPRRSIGPAGRHLIRPIQRLLSVFLF